MFSAKVIYNDLTKCIETWVRVEVCIRGGVGEVSRVDISEGHTYLLSEVEYPESHWV